MVTAAFLWEKLSQPQFYKDLTRKTAFFEGWSWFKFNNLGLALDTNFKLYSSLAKGLKQKVREFWGLIATFAEVTWEKLVGCPPPSRQSRIGLTNLAKIEKLILFSFWSLITLCAVKITYMFYILFKIRFV